MAEHSLSLHRVRERKRPLQARHCHGITAHRITFRLPVPFQESRREKNILVYICLLRSIRHFKERGLFHSPSRIRETIASISIRYPSDAKVSDRCLIDVNTMGWSYSHNVPLPLFSEAFTSTFDVKSLLIQLCATFRSLF